MMERLIDLVFKLINKQGRYYVVVEIIDFLPVQIQPRAFSPASTLFTIPKRIPFTYLREAPERENPPL